MSDFVTAEQDAAIKAGAIGFRDGQAAERQRMAESLGVGPGVIALIGCDDPVNRVAALTILHTKIGATIEELRTSITGVTQPEIGD